MRLKPKSRFAESQSGLAAVEFALLLPMMIPLFLGVVETSEALTCRTAVSSVAGTVADLVAQEKVATAGDITNVYNAAAAILYPHDIGPATVTIYSIVDNGTATGKVAWSCQKIGSNAATAGPTSPPAGSTGGDAIAAGNPDANGNPQYGGNGSVILATISYRYTSPVMQMFVGTVTMTDSFYSKPRRTNQVTAPASCS